MVLLALLSCGEDCVELPVDCTPQYPPTFDRVWEETLLPTCALSGCHATGQGGLTMGTTADEAYAALLRRSPDELNALYHDLLIGVTRFFRDPQAFDALQRTVVGTVVPDEGGPPEVRVWVAGCATGEEA